MTLEFFDVLWFYFLKNCLCGFRFDSSIFPFSIRAHFIPLYSVDFFIGSVKDYDTISGRVNRYTDVIIPFICDIMIVNETR